MLSFEDQHVKVLCAIMCLQQSSQDSSQLETQGENEYAFVGTLDDRSFLSDEMAAVCANLPIHLLKQKNL